MVIRKKRRLLIGGLLSALVAAALYWGAVHTASGQRIDQRIFDSRSTEPLAIRKDATVLLNTVSYTTLPMLAAAVTLLALSAGGWHRALAAGAAITGAVVSSELLKHGLPRPGLIDIDLYHLTHNSFPSGHATIAMSLGLALVIAVSARMRPAAALFAALVAAAFGVATVIGGWHRPSDTLAGYLIAVAWACLVALIMVPRDDAVGSGAPGPRAIRLCRWSGAVLLLFWLGLVLLLLLEFELGDFQLMDHHELLVTLAALAISAMLIVWWWLGRQTDTHNC